MKVRILYEDNHLLVVEKPAGILSQADRSGDPDMLTILKQDLKERYNKPGRVYLGLVHRLDRPVGGVMVFAKTSKAASRLSEQMRKREIRKTYLAVVEGVFKKSEGLLRHYLVKDNRTNTVAAYLASDPDALGKESLLEYAVLGERENLSLVRIMLHTGRPHQIRSQFAASGHPVCGDKKYGKGAGVSGQLALWSWRLAVIHPTLKNEMTFVANPPGVFPWTLFASELEQPD